MKGYQTLTAVENPVSGLAKRFVPIGFRKIILKVNLMLMCFEGGSTNMEAIISNFLLKT
jgi:hypothetical protein